jgi:hypothetical protein
VNKKKQKNFIRLQATSAQPPSYASFSGNPDTMSGLPDSMESDVIEQIHIRSGIPRSQIALDAEVYEDLGVYGMDLWEIIDYLNRRHGVKFDDFRMHDYVPPEVPFLWIWKRLGRYNRFKSLTVGHLIEVARRGAWFEVSLSA